MAKKSKLLAALDAHKGRDFKLEKQKKQQKSAEKKKKSKSQPQPQPQPESSDEEEETDGVAINGKSNGPVAESDGWESDESEDATQMVLGFLKALTPRVQLTRHRSTPQE